MEIEGNSKYRTKRRILTIIVIGIDVFLINRAIHHHGELMYYLILIGAIVVNANFFIFWKYSKSAEIEQTSTVEQIMTAIDDMQCAIPLHEETYVNQADEIVVEDDDRELPIEKDRIEEDERIEILKPQNVIHVDPVYDATINPKNYTERLSRYVMDCGLTNDQNEIREMFSCMATAKLIVLKHEHHAIAERFSELFFEFIGAKLYRDELNEKSIRFADLLTNRYTFKACIKAAQNQPNIIHAMLFRRGDMNDLPACFDKIMDFSLNPLLPCEIEHVEMENKLLMPKNLWFVVIPDHDNEDGISEKLAKSAVIMTLSSAKVTKPLDTVRQNDIKITNEAMSNLLIDGREHDYLEEDDWKKIDQIDRYLREYATFGLDNRLFRQLERYTSAFMMFGGDKKEAIDRMFHAKLLRLVSTLQSDQNEANEAFMLLFERLFDRNDFNKSKELLRSI
jgi:hypothetical protein